MLAGFLYKYQEHLFNIFHMYFINYIETKLSYALQILLLNITKLANK